MDWYWSWDPHTLTVYAARRSKSTHVLCVHNMIHVRRANVSMDKLYEQVVYQRDRFQSNTKRSKGSNQLFRNYMFFKSSERFWAQKWVEYFRFWTYSCFVFVLVQSFDWNCSSAHHAKLRGLASPHTHPLPAVHAMLKHDTRKRISPRGIMY